MVDLIKLIDTVFAEMEYGMTRQERAGAAKMGSELKVRLIKSKKSKKA